MTLLNKYKKINILKRYLKGDTVKKYGDSPIGKIIEKERYRADRNNHTLSLVMIDFDKFDLKNPLMDEIIIKIVDRIRYVDEAGWYDKKKFCVILPYTSNQGARKFAEYISAFMAELTPKPSFTIYTYPNKV